MNLAVGSFVKNRYQILEPLGEGGFAYVWKARDLELARDVAIKFLKIEDSDRAALDETIQRLRREAKLLANLSHQNIVSVFAFDVLDDLTPFIVMEYLTGSPLTKLLAGLGPLDKRLIKEIILQTCAGLSYAHGNGLVHRDLSSSNIFLCNDNEKDTVKIIDFGLSRSSLSTSAKITKTGLLLGNPSYMSPESIVGEPVDCRADIYALGCIIYEMVTGHVPFQTDSVVGLLFKHQKEYPPAPLCESTKAPESERLNAIILRCMQKDRALRFENCDQVTEALISELCFDEILPPTIPLDLKVQWQHGAKEKRRGDANLSRIVVIASIVILVILAFTAAIMPHFDSSNSKADFSNIVSQKTRTSKLSIADKKASSEVTSRLMSINELKKLAVAERNPVEVLRLYKKMLQLQMKIRESLPQEELWTYLAMADLERAQGKFTETENHCRIVVERTSAMNSKIPIEIRNQVLSRSYYVLASSYWDRNETQKAEKTALQALKYADENNRRAIDVLLGDIKLSQGNFDESKRYYSNVALDEVLRSPDVIQLIATLGLSALLDHAGSTREAEKLRIKAENFAVENNMSGNAAQRLFDLGMRFFYLNEFAEAERLYKGSIAIARENEALDYIAHADLHWLGELYFKRNELNKAENKYKEVLAFEKSKQMRSWRGDGSIEQLRIIYSKRNDKGALSSLDKIELERKAFPKQ